MLLKLAGIGVLVAIIIVTCISVSPAPCVRAGKDLCVHLLSFVAYLLVLTLSLMQTYLNSRMLLLSSNRGISRRVRMAKFRVTNSAYYRAGFICHARLTRNPISRLLRSPARARLLSLLRWCS